MLIAFAAGINLLVAASSHGAHAAQLNVFPAPYTCRPPHHSCAGVSQEFFGDFVALDGHHFAIPVERPHCLLQPSACNFGASSDATARMTEGLAALALSLRRRFQIRCNAHALLPRSHPDAPAASDATAATCTQRFAVASD